MNTNDKEHLKFLLHQLCDLIEANMDNAAIYCCIVTDVTSENTNPKHSVVMVGNDKILDIAINNATDYALDFYTK